MGDCENILADWGWLEVIAWFTAALPSLTNESIAALLNHSAQI